MRAIKLGIGPLMLTILVASSVVVAALVLSNVLTYSNEIQGISLTTGWNNSPKGLGTETAFQVSWTSPIGVSGPATIMFKIDRTGIVPGDVTLKYTLNSQMYTANFVQNGAGSIIAETIQLQSGSMSGSYPYSLIFNACGTYTMTIWVG